MQIRIFQNFDKNYFIILIVIENLYHVQSVCLIIISLFRYFMYL